MKNLYYQTPGTLFKIKKNLSLIDPLVKFNVEDYSRYNIFTKENDIVLLLTLEPVKGSFTLSARFTFLTKRNRIGYQLFMLNQHLEFMELLCLKI